MNRVSGQEFHCFTPDMHGQPPPQHVKMFGLNMRMGRGASAGPTNHFGHGEGAAGFTGAAENSYLGAENIQDGRIMAAN